MKKEECIRHYFALVKHLEETYPSLHFKNHCYWRIALDNVLDGKWDTLIDQPAYQHLNLEQLEKVNRLFQAYLEDQDLLLEHNRISLSFRRKVRRG